MSLRGLGFGAGGTRRPGDVREEGAADGVELGHAGSGALEGAADSEITRVMRAVRRPVSRAPRGPSSTASKARGREQEHSNHDAQGSLLARGRDVGTWLTG